MNDDILEMLERKVRCRRVLSLEMCERVAEEIRRLKKYDQQIEGDEEFAGYIHSVKRGGKLYKLQCEVVTVNPIVCPKCGGSFELKYGNGRCNYCGTYFTTKFNVEEVVIDGQD